MKFSIIVPVYNVKDYIDKCITSIVNQVFDDYEIVVVDDGSTDGSGEICDSYKSNYRIKVFHKENGGLSDARNYGINEAKGDYLLFVDADDALADNDCLNNLNEIICKHNGVDFVINRRCDYDERTESLKECDYYFSTNHKDSIELYEECVKQKDFILTAWIFVVNRNYVLSNKFFFYKGILHEDEEWAPKVLFGSNKFEVNNMPIVTYTKFRKDSIVSTVNIKKLADKLKIIDMHTSYFENTIFIDIIRKRCASIYFGILFDLRKCRESSGYQDLLKNMKNKKYVLLYGKTMRYTITYVAVSVFGPSVASNLLHIISHK